MGVQPLGSQTLVGDPASARGQVLRSAHTASRPPRDRFVRLLLDEHVSPSVSEALRAKSYDVKAVAESTLLRGLDDDEILHQATADRRAVVTRNFADFLAVSVDWASSKREHFGIVLVSAAFSVVESARTSKSSRPPLDPFRRHGATRAGRVDLAPCAPLRDCPML